ncbi:MAG: response regulator transcription factor [Bdellovibrionales bacterium]|nr:response regulator transcription factor [Bdellovibrionales bacterium]
MKILLAEDDQSICTVARICLEKIGGHQVTVVNDGKAAVDQSVIANFDVILLDGMMPVLDGISACKQMISLGIKSPIIFMTAKSQESDILDSLSAGAIGYIQKPFDPQTLPALIQSILSQKGRLAA